jgi:putative ABC transport system permease protein
MSEEAITLPVPARLPSPSRLAWAELLWEVVLSGFRELRSHKLRSILTLTLLALGVFALVVMTSVMDGVVDKVSTGFKGLSFDGTIQLNQKSPETTEEQKRFAMSPGLRYEDLSRLTSPHPKVRAFLPRAMRQTSIRIGTGLERTFATGVTAEYFPWQNRPIASGRALTDDDSRRRSAVAVLGGTLASKLFAGSDPVGRNISVDGQSFQVIGVLAPLQIMSDDTWLDANGLLMPIEAYMDRMDTKHSLSRIYVKLAHKEDMTEVTSALLARARQAHHGIDDTETTDLAAELMQAYKRFEQEIWGWKVVMQSLAATVLLVGGVGVLSVMLISFSDRRYEIGLRKAMGATDHQIFVQFLLEALVLAVLGAFFGTIGGSFVCKALSSQFPWGLVVNAMGLVTAWIVALALSLVFGMYPAFRAMKLSPMEAMR